MKKEHKIGIAVIGFIVLVIIGIVAGGGKAAPTGNTSPIASGSMFASPVDSPGVTAASVRTPTAVATKAKARAKPRRTAAPATPVPVTSKAVAPPPPPPTTAPAAAPSTPSGCYPLTDGGNCYEPGEYCRDSDHGASGVAGDGESIICEDNDGWRWEPA
jgi:type IV secretory pathway VirB10-like protein